jgi:hypothetical protein
MTMTCLGFTCTRTYTQRWARAFLVLALAPSRPRAETYRLALSRSFFRHYFALFPLLFCAPALLIFRARIFALIFCVHTFALMHLYIYMQQREDSQSGTVGIEQDS